MRTCALLAAACLLGASASAQTPSVEPAAPATTQTLSVNASLVAVPVTVRDKKDHLIRTLTRDDFTLTVDGKAQNLRYFDREDDLPLTVGLLVDVSGSQRTVLDAERTASSAFLDGMLQPGRDRAFVVQFGHSADLLADITPSVAKLQAALQKIDADTDKPSFSNGGSSTDPQDTSQGDTRDQGNGKNGSGGGRRGGSGRGGSRGANGSGTVLYDAVFLSSDEILKKAPSKDGQTRKAIILLTTAAARNRCPQRLKPRSAPTPRSTRSTTRAKSSTIAASAAGSLVAAVGAFPVAADVVAAIPAVAEVVEVVARAASMARRSSNAWRTKPAVESMK